MKMSYRYIFIFLVAGCGASSDIFEVYDAVRLQDILQDLVSSQNTNQQVRHVLHNLNRHGNKKNIETLKSIFKQNKITSPELIVKSISREENGIQEEKPKNEDHELANDNTVLLDLNPYKIFIISNGGGEREVENQILKEKPKTEDHANENTVLDLNANKIFLISNRGGEKLYRNTYVKNNEEDNYSTEKFLDDLENYLVYQSDVLQLEDLKLPVNGDKHEIAELDNDRIDFNKLGNDHNIIDSIHSNDHDDLVEFRNNFVDVDKISKKAYSQCCENCLHQIFDRTEYQDPSDESQVSCNKCNRKSESKSRRSRKFKEDIHYKYNTDDLALLRCCRRCEKFYLNNDDREYRENSGSGSDDY